MAVPMPAPIRVAVVADPGGLGVHPDVRAAVEAAAAALEDAGYGVEEVDDVPGWRTPSMPTGA